jgi:DNA-directed RNA polymerase subunit RPC12/RpoP
MKESAKKKIGIVSTVIGACVAGVIGVVYHLSTFSGPSGDSAALTGLFVMVTGTAFLGGLGGAFVGFLITVSLPKEKVACPSCGSPNALAAHKSIVDGRPRPNRCPDCNHQW